MKVIPTKEDEFFSMVIISSGIYLIITFRDKHIKIHMGLTGYKIGDNNEKFSGVNYR